VTPKKIIKDVNDGVPHGFCKLTETRLRDKLIAAESIIKSATDITPHDVRWKDKLTKEWIETSQFFKADTMNALEKLDWQWVRDRNLPSDRRFQFQLNYHGRGVLLKKDVPEDLLLAHLVRRVINQVLKGA
jgi:hypothetical protein